MKPEKENSAPIGLDKNVTCKKKTQKMGKKKVPKMYLFGGIGLILLITILFINPQNGEYIDSPPPEEQAERDSIYNTILLIQQYQTTYDSLPTSTDIPIPLGLHYEIEDDLSWFIETETNLFYSSDMDPDLFKIGEI